MSGGHFILSVLTWEKAHRQQTVRRKNPVKLVKLASSDVQKYRVLTLQAL